MSDTLSMQEIIEIAIEIEKNGVKFYQALMESAKTDRVKELFSYLADAEKQHIVTIRESDKQIRDSHQRK